MRFARRGVPALLLVALTVAALGGIVGNGFVDLDDGEYITHNRLVLDGLSGRGIVAAFTSTRQAAAWQPLTWLSHMFDVELFGPRPGPHHAVSLAIHVANALLLLSLLLSLTGALWRSAIVAALFAVHPLHVESVAWAAERRDVLSTFFLLCTALAYVRAARRDAVARSAAVPLLFALALMSKAMVVTLPFLLLLLDWWPLNRWGPAAWRGADGSGTGSLLPPARLWIEKLPLFVLSAALAVATVAAARQGGSIASAIPVLARFSNACVAYATYLGKTVWPLRLSPYYPYPGAGHDPAAVTGAIALLAALSVLAWREASRRPHLALGWLWYLGALVPVIGVIQAGGHAMADRYTYLPLIGIFVAATWGAGEALRRRRRRALPAFALASVVLAALAVAARMQAVRWRDSRSLFTHALRLDANNWVAWNGLGIMLREQGSPDAAAEHFLRSLEIEPGNADTHVKLGGVLFEVGRLEEAIGHLRRAVALKPASAVAFNNLGVALAQTGSLEEAEVVFRRAVALDGGSADARLNLGLALLDRGKLDAAADELLAAAALEPGSAGVAAALGRLRGQPAGEAAYARAAGGAQRARALPDLRGSVPGNPASPESRRTSGAGPP